MPLKILHVKEVFSFLKKINFCTQYAICFILDCYGSGSELVGTVIFWASRIRTRHYLFKSGSGPAPDQAAYPSINNFFEPNLLSLKTDMSLYLSKKSLK